MRLADLGVWGLGVMGRSLALNFARHGRTVALYEREAGVADEFVRRAADPRRFLPTGTPADFVAALRPPRICLVMVKAGPPVDAVLDALRPELRPGDIVIEGGNSRFTDTIARARRLAAAGIHLLGTGVSGGEQGALHGPSLMPGGERTAYERVAPLLTDIAAHVDGRPCCAWIGPDGAGHFVKMVHNAIEYGVMQLLAETYLLMRDVLGLSAGEMATIFTRWNEGVLGSYLVEITAQVLARVDAETGRPLVDLIRDQAEQKGTGSWGSQHALELGIPTPTLTEAVFARCLSARQAERVRAAQELPGPGAHPPPDRAPFLAALHDTLHMAKLGCYAQGFALLAAAGGEFSWPLDLAEIARVWRGGCIIRARLLEDVRAAFATDPSLPNVLLAPQFRDTLQAAQASWRAVVAAAVQRGVPTPALSAALAYYDGVRTARSGANLIQAQRDLFGAHTYQRRDRPGTFHTDWTP